MLRPIQASRLSDCFHGLLFQSDGSTCFSISNSHGRSLSAHPHHPQPTNPQRVLPAHPEPAGQGGDGIWCGGAKVLRCLRRDLTFPGIGVKVELSSGLTPQKHTEDLT